MNGDRTIGDVIAAGTFRGAAECSSYGTYLGRGRLKRLQEDPTRVPSLYSSHFTRTKPRLESPQPTNPHTSLR